MKENISDFDTVAWPHVVQTVTTDYSSWNSAVILGRVADMAGLHLSSWASSQTAFPGALAVRCGHMTEFWPMAYEQKGWPSSPGRAHKNFPSWMFPSLSPSVNLMVNTPKTRGGQHYKTAAAWVLACPLEESWPTRNFHCVTVCHSS